MNASLLILSLFIRASLFLRMVRVSVPAYRVRGQPAELYCCYRLEGDSLYSVQWYRDHEQFYRYMPSHEPPRHAYALDGLHVDLTRSDQHRVTLRQVTLKSSGVFRCEVSAEAPSFASAAGEGRMEVLYLPRDGPKIVETQEENQKGDFLFLNCTSGRSFPAAMLSWDIDGQQVSSEQLLVPYPPAEHQHGLLTSALGLRLRRPRARALAARCTARVAPSWLEGSDAGAGNTHLADTKEAVLLVSSGSPTTAPVPPAPLFVISVSGLFLCTLSTRPET